MKYSIIIATYNAGKYLTEAIESALHSTHDSTELILIDGGSKDDTLEIINKYNESISYWISEPDNGIYDAWNKGITKATGDWIMFIGADDRLLPKAINSYTSFIERHPERDSLLYVSSRMQMVDQNGKLIRVKGWSWEWPKFLKETTVAHPGSLHSKKLFEKYGMFDTNYRSAGDFELLIRPKDQLKAAFMDEVTVVMQEGGISDGTIGIKEHCIAAIKTGGYSPFLAYKNAIWVFLKFKIRTTLRKYGINAYLKK